MTLRAFADAGHKREAWSISPTSAQCGRTGTPLWGTWYWVEAMPGTQVCLLLQQSKHVCMIITFAQVCHIFLSAS